MQEAIILRGLPGSGKSTWVEKFCSEHNPPGVLQKPAYWTNGKPMIYYPVSLDEERDFLSKGEYSKGTLKWTPKFEKEVQKEYFDRLEWILGLGQSVILDNTHLNPKSFRKIQTHLSQKFPSVVQVIVNFMDVSVNTCLERDRQRKKDGKRYVGDNVILEMWSKFIKPNIPKPEYVLGENAIIVDLDGTLAIVGDRVVYDASKCDELDKPNPAVLDLITTYKRTPGVCIFFTSGRQEKE